MLKIWDCNDERSIHSIKVPDYLLLFGLRGLASIVSFDAVTQAHDYEILSLDWNKYNENILATGSIDKSIRLWDMRNLSTPITTLHGHNYAVRRLKFSPHSERTLASVS